MTGYVSLAREVFPDVSTNITHSIPFCDSTHEACMKPHHGCLPRTLNDHVLFYEHFAVLEAQVSSSQREWRAPLGAWLVYSVSGHS
jgi:hypothetical protein